MVAGLGQVGDNLDKFFKFSGPADIDRQVHSLLVEQQRGVGVNLDLGGEFFIGGSVDFGEVDPEFLHLLVLGEVLEDGSELFAELAGAGVEVDQREGSFLESGLVGLGSEVGYCSLSHYRHDKDQEQERESGTHLLITCEL